MSTRPLISIITPSFNSQKTIARTIESLLTQTYENIEYIIVDGGSTDSTVDIIKQYESKFSGKLRMISESDCGMYDAMNKGILLATGKLIGILNSDDWYEPDAIESMTDIYMLNDDSVLYGILRYIENNRETMLYRMHHESLKDGMITHPTCFVPKVIYEKYGTFDMKYLISADYELMLRFKKNNVKFIPVDKIIANFSFGGLSTLNNDGLIESLRIRNKYNYISYGRMIWEIFKLQVKSLLKKINITG